MVWPSGDFRSRQMLSLPALHLDAPKPWNMLRKGSPPSGSILMTRAPRSASTEAPSGAAMMVALSTTVTPCSGRCGAAPLGRGTVTERGARSLKVVSLTASPALPGDCVRFASRPSCLPPLRSTTWPLATTSGSSSASWVVWYGWETTPPSATKMSVHSASVLVCMCANRRSRNPSSVSRGQRMGSPSYFGSRSSSASPEARKKLAKRCGSRLPSCSQWPSLVRTGW